MFDKKEIIRYLEDCHIEDGGYYFAKIAPSSGLDTCFAVKTLQMLGVKPAKIDPIVQFWRDQDAEGNLSDVTGLYFSVETIKALGLPLDNFTKYKKFLESYERKTEDKSDNIPIDIEIAPIYADLVDNEAQTIFYLVTLLKDLNCRIDNTSIKTQLNFFQNNDGGFGVMKGSQLATTFYCLSITDLIGYKLENKDQTECYLFSELGRVNYLEEYYWAVESLVLLEKIIPNKDKIITFLNACKRDNGGFSRSQFMGISTIEYTFQAVSLLKRLGELN